jgi:3-hydroxyacyl-CoA dehydrogenase
MSSHRPPRKIAVLGSGVMGSAIAAHFANAGIPSLLLDIVPRELDERERAAGLSLDDRRVRDRLATQNLAAMAKARPAALFSPTRLRLIEPGNLTDDLPRLAEVDWVIEAVREDMTIKKQLLPEVARHLGAAAWLSSNTSGLSLTEMAETLPEDLRPRFLGTHFFNPPRYMELLELIPTPYTDPQVMDRVGSFCTRRLGKGAVPAKDTPNFIANRIGVHALMTAVQVMDEDGLTIEEVDAITGPPMTRPKTATFRLVDLVGVDTILDVVRNSHALLEQDESREVFVPPDWLPRMVERGLRGRKAKAGFYKKDKRAILTLDLESLEYREPRKPQLPELKELAGIADPARRVAALVQGAGRAAASAWKMLAATLCYSASRLGEVADEAWSIDRALRLGFNWELGPFEIWDALGFRPATERMRSEGRSLPDWVDALYESGAETIYRRDDGALLSPVARPGGLASIEDDPREIRTERLRGTDARVKGNDSASLLDLGEGVLGLEFHTKMNAIDQGTVEMMRSAVDEAERDWQALVVANDGTAFCAGANLMMLVQYAEAGEWEPIERMVRDFQRANDALERCAVPVVVAPHGLALGGGCEVTLAGNAIRAAAESYIGLVEVGAGVIPAGGGCMRLYRRHVAALPDGRDLYPALRAAFETVGMAKVSTSAEEARELGFLRPDDGWSMNRRHVIADARDLALTMARGGYAPPPPGRTVPVMGRSGLAVLESGLINMLEGRFISEHDRRIGRELALIVSGGDVAGPTEVSEQHLLDLECESFLRLCGESKSRERMKALLATGKPLRN